ncbi:MAG: ESCRT-III subunit protein snf7 [Chaenotheca gracillima]|nr:MAG: ESCRT-III subunit protein snf7 [Chaenotheca gracillima]
MQGIKNYFRPPKAQRTEVSEKDSKAVAHDGAHATRSPTLQGTPQASRPGSSYRNSRPSSLYPQGDFRNEEADAVMELKCEMMANHLWQQQRRRLWAHDRPNEGIVLKKTKAQYTCAPRSLQYDGGGLFEAIRDMNVRIAMTINTRVVKVIMAQHEGDFVPLADGLRLQIVGSMQDLPACQKHHFAAFIADEKTLVVWDDDPNQILERAKRIETQLIKMSWGESSGGHEKSASEKEASAIVEEVGSDATSEDLEEGLKSHPRPTHLLNPIMVGLTIVLIICALGLGWRILVQEVLVDPKYGIPRLGLLALTPLEIFLSLFFMQIVVSNLMQIFGPTSQLKSNSKFYSAKAPPRLRQGLHTLPHVTIQCPVYKEGLVSVIQPTILSIKAAISTYEMQGGTANIFVNDDGMQLISVEDAQARKDFYDEHHIGWVSRPGHNPKPEEGERQFLRRGKFKKV